MTTPLLEWILNYSEVKDIILIAQFSLWLNADPRQMKTVSSTTVSAKRAAK